MDLKIVCLFVCLNEEMNGHADAVFGQSPDGQPFEMALSCLLLGLFTPNLGIL